MAVLLYSLFVSLFVALKCDKLGLAIHIWLEVIYSELYTQILNGATPDLLGFFLLSDLFIES